MHIHERRRTGRGGSRVLLGLALAAAVGSAACQRRAPAQAAPAALRIAFGIGPTVKASGVRLLTDLLYNEPLISHDATGRPGPALAQSWRWEEEGRLLRLRLKPGVVFHDGTPLTAPLVVRVLEGSGRTLGFDRVTGMEAIGELDIDIRLSQPDVFLLTALNEVRIAHPDRPDIGTGPFEIVRRTPVVEARRFERYHGGRPGSAEVQILTYESQRAAWAALMRGEVDAAQEISREAVDFMERTSQIRTYSSPQPFYIPLVLNHRHPALGDPRVRRALGHALDRERIVERAMRRRGIVADGPVWRFHWAHEVRETPAYAPGTVVDALEKAGYPLRPAAPGAPASRLTFRCLIWSEDPLYERIALMVQRQLFDIGVHVELQPVTLQDLAARASTGEFDAFLARANAGRSLMFTYLFWRSPGADEPAIWQTGYSGADEALDRMRASTTEDELRQALRALGDRFAEDAPAVFIAWTEVTRAITTQIAVGGEAGTDPFTSIWKWSRAAPGSLP